GAQLVAHGARGRYASQPGKAPLRVPAWPISRRAVSGADVRLAGAAAPADRRAAGARLWGAGARGGGRVGDALRARPGLPARGPPSSAGGGARPPPASSPPAH